MQKLTWHRSPDADDAVISLAPTGEGAIVVVHVLTHIGWNAEEHAYIAENAGTGISGKGHSDLRSFTQQLRKIRAWLNTPDGAAIRTIRATWMEIGFDEAKAAIDGFRERHTVDDRYCSSVSLFCAAEAAEMAS